MSTLLLYFLLLDIMRIFFLTMAFLFISHKNIIKYGALCFSSLQPSCTVYPFLLSQIVLFHVLRTKNHEVLIDLSHNTTEPY